MKRIAASRWMQTSNYGRAIASRAARYSARYYRIIIAALVVTLLILEAVHTNPFLWAITVGVSFLYMAYVVGRLLLPTRWVPSYYTPRVQFWRAQAGIVGVTVLLASYAIFHHSSSFWVLYLLAVMIVSEHCDTSALLLTVGEISLLLIGLGYVDSGLPLRVYLRFSPALITASLHALTILLLGFLLHYLVRNVGARDTTIARYREVLDTLAGNVRSLHDPQEARTLVLNVCQAMCDASCGSIWALDPQTAQLILAACTGEDGRRHSDCPAAKDSPHGFSMSLDDDQLPACVASTGRPHFASRADNPPGRLANALPAPRPFLPHARLELGVPIPDFQPHQPASLAVLCLAFDRAMKHEEMRQEYDALREMAHYLSPTLYHASLLEQHQALQQLVQTVTHSLDRDRVLDTLLELVTSVFGFDFATVSLVDEVQGIIRTARGQNVPDEWIAMAVHSLDSDDIQADIVRTGRTEILTGWDERFDQKIWERFGHKDMVRVFVPMTVADPVTGQEKHIGTLETGYRGGDRERITREQVNLLHPFVDQAAVAVANAHLYEQLQSKVEALTALHHGGQAIQSAVWRPRRLLEQIGHAAEQVLAADIVLLFGYDEKNQRAELLFTGGDVWGEGEPAPRLGEGNILDAIIRECRSFYFPDAQREPLLVGYGGADGRRRRTFTQRQKVISFAGVPLLSGEELVGIMCVDYRNRHYFSADERCIIELFAQQAALALESARLREQDRKLAIAQERAAFSRELHHSVSHDLFAVALKARTGLHHLDTHDGRVARDLGDILDIAENANRQLGYLISEFGAPVLDNQDFRLVLQETVERVRRYYDIEIHCSGNGQVDVSTRVHFALSRIIKEALNNVIRHAHCRCVTISYTLCQEGISLEIVDDGVGFEPERALHRKGKLGLRNMQAYARDLGCKLDLQSAPGQGTRVAVCVPLHVSSVSSEGSLTCAS
ncbi:MAG: GAF domain-containing protein [Chloroflexota bacterium]|nr:GAF domain-containing protein [Chloroflexota bacterium]